jgi:hypothetical protein
VEAFYPRGGRDVKVQKIRISLQKQFLGEEGEKQNAKNKRTGAGKMEDLEIGATLDILDQYSILINK